ncbi:hypothetical protein GN958_ATG18103 [Phytophthora infestans]|uniref:Uncharacterized protein n=1 Tax=Phytophthora infestans TaxID=4787 RepID=A0A8S9TVH2_PHYIN|nr:hypothetical protein GN958_ATG18103 [Phytophthora infestans]
MFTSVKKPIENHNKLLSFQLFSTLWNFATTGNNAVSTTTKQTIRKQKKTYLSSVVKYEIRGVRDATWFLNVTAVSNNVNTICSRSPVSTSAPLAKGAYEMKHKYVMNAAKMAAFVTY